jgi:hypothetical protein
MTEEHCVAVWLLSVVSLFLSLSPLSSLSLFTLSLSPSSHTLSFSHPILPFLTARDFVCGYGKYTYVSSLSPEVLEGFVGETAAQRQAREETQQKSYFYRAFEVTYCDYFASIIEENEAAEKKFEKEENEAKEHLAKTAQEDKLKAEMKEKENSSSLRSNVTDGQGGGEPGVHVIEDEDESEGEKGRREGSHTEPAAAGTAARVVEGDAKEGEKDADKEEETPLMRSRRQFEDMLGIRL